MQTGILGGSFNPPHTGHKRLALEARKALGLDRIFVIPSCLPPHKTPHLSAAPESRVEMCRLLFPEGIFEVLTIETDRGGISYSVDTLTELKKRYPEDVFTFIIGSDMLLTFDKWYKYKEILQMCSLCAVSRLGEDNPEKLRRFAKEELRADNVTILNALPFEVSSTEIRAEFLSGKTDSPYVTEEVREYIIKNRLYTAE